MLSYLYNLITTITCAQVVQQPTLKIVRQTNERGRLGPDTAGLWNTPGAARKIAGAVSQPARMPIWESNTWKSVLVLLVSLYLDWNLQVGASGWDLDSEFRKSHSRRACCFEVSTPLIHSVILSIIAF